MSFSISKKNFYDVLQKTFPFVPSKSSLQILSNFKISIGNGVLEVTATDLDHSIKVKTPVSGTDVYEIAVNARKLFEIVREIEDGEITLDVDEQVLILESGDSFSCRIAGTDVKDFPSFPDINEAKSFDIGIDVLKNMIPKSVFAVSRDETRACLCGVYWEVEKEKTVMVATDGHRLGCAVCTKNFELDEKISCIVSPKTLMQVTKTMGLEIEENINIKFGEKYVSFSTDTVSVFSKLIDGPYPDYEKAIPKNNQKKAIIEKSKLQDAVRRVSVLCNNKTHLIRLMFTKGILEIVVLNRDIGGEAKQKIKIDYDGEEHIIGLNAAYLSEILSIAGTKNVRMEMSTQISACLIYPVEEKPEDSFTNDVFLIMPLRIMEEM
jgi:DNA polymerase-3 subunit beta